TQFKIGKMSVLLIGIDSISRLNLIRTMPKTVKYLDSNGWVDLRGYNKVDDNTFPNLMAILTGKTVDQVRSSCWPTPNTRMDDCPFVWKDFSDRFKF
ncbi:DUF229 domain-containing protein, partial [Klebsiella pneumoniae]|uniref:DUF229 domain-containing protein n=1 Tax=Klebsiella pneumoniae TaxID=573 RepID=UPI00405544F6